MKIVFDLDDTICVTRNRDYANAAPIAEVVDAMRQAKSLGATIVIHTARGMLSCGGDVAAAEKKNIGTIQEWLKKQDVPCDELIFGKPYADLYVDDKGVSVQDFGKGITVMHGFSGSKVLKIGNRVIKEQANCNDVKEWYESASDIECPMITPMVYTAGNGVIQMEYIDGCILAECATPNRVYDVITTIRAFERQVLGENDIDDYLRYVSLRADGEFPHIMELLASEDLSMLREKTFCHGDMSLRNIIVREDGQMVMFDPSIKDCQSWLLDASKFRASLDGLDEATDNGKRRLDLLTLFDHYFTRKQLRLIKVLEITHMIRVWHYARVLHNSIAQDILREHIKRLYLGL